MSSHDEHDLHWEDLIPFQAGRAERQSLLDEWSATTQMRDQVQRHRRYEFEDRLVPAEIIHPGGGSAHVEVLMVNLSAGGCCLIHRGYLHPSTECKLYLLTNSGQSVSAHATVKWCQLLRGVYHSTGLEWDAPIQPRDFIDPRVWLELSQAENPQSNDALEGRFLLLTGDQMQDMLMHMLLRESEAELKTIDTSGGALDAVRSGGYDIVIIDTDDDEIDVESMPARLHGEGYTGPVLALTHENGPASIEALRECGYAETLIKPLREDTFAMGVHMALDHCANAASGTGPIFSSLASQENTRQWISDYLDIVRQRASTLEEAARADDTSVARQICDSIRDSGTSYGFPLLTEIANSALTAVNASGSANEALSCIRQLIRVIERLSLTPEEAESADDQTV